MAGMPVGYADRGERGRCDQVGESSVIIVADDRVRALVREVAGEDAVIVAADEVRPGQRVDLVVEGRRPRPAPVGAGPPRLVLDALGGCDRERLVWCLDMGRGLDGGLVADRCRVAALRAEEIAEHLRVRARSSLGKAAWHMRRRVRGTADRRQHMPRGAGALPVDTATDDPPLPERPSVSVVVPTRDGPELLAQILAGVRSTRWPDLELILVDNGTRDRDALRLLGSSDAHVERLSIPFNFPRLVNRGVHAASGDVVVLLNNDVELVDPNWPVRLVAALRDPGVGVVGVPLIYPDGTLQHAGMAITGGVPVHPLAGRDLAEPAVVAATAGGERTAVTAACMALRRATFIRLGGLDPLLAHDYNDLDLCLRARRAGYRVRLVDTRPLVHHESRSRGRDVAADTVGDWLVARSRWADVLARPDVHWRPE